MNLRVDLVGGCGGKCVLQIIDVKGYEGKCVRGFVGVNLHVERSGGKREGGGCSGKGREVCGRGANLRSERGGR